MIKDLFDKHTNLAAFLLIAGLVFLVYAPVINGAFLWDDILLIVENQYIKSFRHIPDIFTSTLGAGSGTDYPFYRPLFNLTLLIDHAFWGLNPVGYHLTTILIHILASFLLFVFLRKVTGLKNVALISSLAFAVHPILSEDVAYITGRADSLVAVLLFASLLVEMREWAKPYQKYALLFLCTASAILVKEIGIIIPAILLFYQMIFRRKIYFLSIAAALIPTLIFLIARFVVFAGTFVSPVDLPSFAERLPGAFVAFFRYLKLLDLPFPLHMEYGQPVFSWFHVETILGVFLFLIFIVLLLVSWKKERGMITFGLAWFLIAWVPVSNVFVPASSFMAERYMYIPLLGLYPSAFLFLRTIPFFRRKIAVYLLIVYLFYLGFLTFRQSFIWRDPLIFYRHTLKYVSGSARLHNNLGTVYKERGQIKEAIASYKNALRIKPDYAESYYNLGVIYVENLGNKKLGMSAYQKALNIGKRFRKGKALINYTDVQTYSNLAMLYLEDGNAPQALRLLDEALKLAPNAPKIYNNLGIVCKTLGLDKKAIDYYNKSIALDPAYAEAYYNLGSLYTQAGNAAKALINFEKALKLEPENVNILNNIANAYKNLGKIDLAVEYLKKTVTIKPDYARGHYNLSLLYYHQGRMAEAKTHAEEALKNGYPVDARFVEVLNSK